MKTPSPSNIPFNAVGGQLTARNADFIGLTIVFCENTFRIVGFFVYTCLAFGLLSATCHQNPFLWLFVLFLGFLFWLYFWNVTLGVGGYAVARRIKSEKARRNVRMSIKAAVIGLSIFCFVFVSFADLIDAYVLRLFPEAQLCDMYSAGAPEQKSGVLEQD